MLTFEIGSISGKWSDHSKGVRSSSKKPLISSSIEMFAAERGVRDNPTTCNHALHMVNACLFWSERKLQPLPVTRPLRSAPAVDRRFRHLAIRAVRPARRLAIRLFFPNWQAIRTLTTRKGVPTRDLAGLTSITSGGSPPLWFARIVGCGKLTFGKFGN